MSVPWELRRRGLQDSLRHNHHTDIRRYGSLANFDLIMFNPDEFADYHRHFELLKPYIEKLHLQLHLDDIAEA
jgi:hypothetical protein